MQTRDTTATRGAQVGPFDATRTVIEDAADSMDGPDSVPTRSNGSTNGSEDSPNAAVPAGSAVPSLLYYLNITISNLYNGSICCLLSRW